jgi:dihydropyrimidinase
MSEAHSFVVTGGKVLLPDGSLIEADLAIRDGKISAVLERGFAGSYGDVVDARGLTILPGVVDAHLHLGHGTDISRPRIAQDAAVETAAAAFGGITTFIPYLMGNTPYEDGTFADAVRVTEEGARIDFGYHLVISTEEQLNSVPKYINEFGVPSLKIFMTNRGGEGKRLGMPDIDDGFLFRLAEICGRNNGLLCPHPENVEVAFVLRDRMKARDPNGESGLAGWNESRPPFVEADAVQRAAVLARAAGAQLYIVHASSGLAIQAALQQRATNDAIIIETCPHYLTHTFNWEGGIVGKINPPLRSAPDCEALWAAIQSGAVDTVASDHVHRPLNAKQGNIWTASPGCPGLETLLPVMLTEGFHKRGIPLHRIAKLVSENPARIMGLTNKGRIAVGADADLALIDLNREWTLESDQVVSSAGYSIYEGWRFKGRVVHTMVRGHFVLRDGVLNEDRVGSGRYISRRLQ